MLILFNTYDTTYYIYNAEYEIQKYYNLNDNSLRNIYYTHTLYSEKFKLLLTDDNINFYENINNLNNLQSVSAYIENSKYILNYLNCNIENISKTDNYIYFTLVHQLSYISEKTITEQRLEKFKKYVDNFNFNYYRIFNM
jgi:hypothetical protein